MFLYWRTSQSSDVGWENFGLSSSFCSLHFVLFLSAFVYLYLVSFSHRDLDHGSVCDDPLSLLCGTCSSLSFSASVTEVNVLDWSVRGCLEKFYGMCSVYLLFWCYHWFLGTPFCALVWVFAASKKGYCNLCTGKNTHYSN